MSVLFADGPPWWLVLAGWSLIVALWHTSAIALGLATWRLWRPRATALAQYMAASGGLALALAATVATPVALRWRPAPSAAASIEPSAATVAIAHADRTALPVRALEESWHTTATSTGTRVSPWLGALWCAGVLVGLLRFAGGWALAQWIRRRATQFDGPHLVGAIADASAEWGLPPAALLSSAHVDAPVVIGARAPAIILPVDLERHLDEEMLPALLAHELAHVRRGDYAANLVQAIADALLWFSPGARFISRCVREAREFCCDDVVAARCGAGPYASALTTLAGLGVVARSRPVVNAAGPRLIVRIRRLLQEDATTSFAGYRLGALLGSLALAAAAGFAVVPLSAAGLAQATAAPFTAPIDGSVPESPRKQPALVYFTAPIDGPVPMGFVARQSGAAVRVRDMTSSETGYCGTATLENLANVAVTGVRLAAHVMARFDARSSLSSVAYTTSPLIAADVPAGGTADVAVNLVSLNDLQQTLRTGRPQVMCALTEIRYANGSVWSAPPASVFAPAHAEVSRTLLDGDPTPGAPICRDETGGEYSEGAVVPIALEPGTFARCHDGAWAEYALPPAKPDAPAR